LARASAASWSRRARQLGHRVAVVAAVLGEQAVDLGDAVLRPDGGAEIAARERQACQPV
jgi:hypothetical protein